MEPKVIELTHRDLMERIHVVTDHLRDCCSEHCEMWDELDNDLFLLGYVKAGE